MIYYDNNAEVLIALLRVAFTKSITIKLPSDIDWHKVIRISYLQEVNCLAVDGLAVLSECKGNCFTQLNISIPKNDKLKWFGQCLAQERTYKLHFAVAKEISYLYDSNGITTYVLKGFSISNIYPLPSHRFSCDMDCFLISHTGTLAAYKQGNEIISSKGYNVNSEYYKHSVFTYKGLTIENHRYCCSVKRSKRTKDLERYLEGLLNGYTPQYIDDTKLALPPEMFQALFMIEHANGHFLYSKMSIKHVCDWAMMRQAFKDTLDWNEFDKQCIRFGLKNFVDCLNHLADYILGKCSYQDLHPIDKRVLEDTFKEVSLSKNLMKQRLEKAIGVLRSSWKFKHFCGDSMIKELSHSVWAYLAEDNPELE